MTNGKLVFFLWLTISSMVLAPMVRKTLPGEPVIVETVPLLLLICLLPWVVRGVNYLNEPVRLMLAAIILILIPYWLLAGFSSILLMLITPITKMLPWIVVPVAALVFSQPKHMISLASALSVIGIVLIPFAVANELFGPNVLPDIFRANERIIELHQEVRSGFPIFVGPFSTFQIAGLTYMASFFVNIAVLCLPIKLGKRKWLIWLGAISYYILVFLSLRRGAFYGINIGALVFLLLNRTTFIKWIFGSILIFIVLAVGLFEASFFYGNPEFTQRNKFIASGNIRERITDVFWELTYRQIATRPFGSYLGNASPEGNRLGSEIGDSFEVIEVGAAFLVAEIGIFGAILIVGSQALILIHLYWLLRGHIAFNALRIYWLYCVLIGLIFLLKEASVFTNLYFHSFMYFCFLGVLAFETKRMNVVSRKAWQTRRSPTGANPGY